MHYYLNITQPKSYLMKIEQLHIPTGNNVHVTCMFHANFINLHAQQNMHVIMLMYKHVSCNMQGFRTFSMHVTCMLHA